MAWLAPVLEALWQNALAVIPLVTLVALLCRFVPMRPATRHTLWVIALVSFIAPNVLPEAPARPNWLAARSADQPDAAPPAAESVEPVPTDEFARRAPRVTNVARPGPTALEWLPVAPGLGELKSSNDHPPSTWAAGDEPRSPAEKITPLPWPLEPGLRQTPQASAPPGIYSPAPAEAAAAPGVAPRQAFTTTPAAPTASSDVAARRARLRSAGVSDAEAPLPGMHEQAVAARKPSLWLDALLSVRTTVLMLPPIPVGLWVAGGVLLALLHAGQVTLFRRRIQRSLPAPKTVARGVHDAARALGLSSVPETRMTETRVSPLVWCGRRPLLVLPTRLWSQLDKHGRRAILLHELAHLRRRDHWVTWLELLITAIYWWHPLLWIIRRRLHDEADLCCDAWVTWQMPNGRRAYAEALLRTKQFLSNGHTPVPSGGMGVTSVGAKRFARRLTMVMTRSERPGSTISGAALALAVAATGWLSAPVWSCPPEEKATQSESKLTVTTSDGSDVVVLSGEDLPQVITFPGGQPKSTNLKSLLGRQLPGNVAIAPKGEGWMQLVQDGGADEGELQRQLERLSADLNRLAEELESLRAPVQQARGRAAVAPRVAQSAGRSRATAIEGGSMSRGYTMAADKLELLFELMKRADVPVQVSLNGDEIQVNGSAADHAAFAGFVDVLNDDNEMISREYSLPEGKREALYNLLALDSVKVVVSRSGDALGISATRSQHAAIAAFIESINPEGGSASASGVAGARGWVASGAAAADVAKELKARAKAAKAPKAEAEKVERRAREEAQAADEKRRRTSNWPGLDADVAQKLKQEWAERGAAWADQGAAWSRLGQAWSGQHSKALHESIAKAVAQASKAGSHVEHMHALAGEANAEHYARIAESFQRQAEAMNDEAGKLGEHIARIVEHAMSNAGKGKMEAGRLEAAVEAQARKLEEAARKLEQRARELEEKARKMGARTSRAATDELNQLADEAAAEADELAAELAEADADRAADLEEIFVEADQALAEVMEAEAALASDVEIIEAPSDGVQD